MESKGFVETQIIPHAENWGDVLFVKETHEQSKDFQELETRIVTWIKDYVTKNKLNSLVVGVSGGIDSAVVSTLCANWSTDLCSFNATEFKFYKR